MLLLITYTSLVHVDFLKVFSEDNDIHQIGYQNIIQYLWNLITAKSPVQSIACSSKLYVTKVITLLPTTSLYKIAVAVAVYFVTQRKSSID